MATRRKATLLAQGKPRTQGGVGRPWRVRLYAPESGGTKYQVMFRAPAGEGEPGHATLVAPDGKQVPIPAKLFQVLEEAANVLALGDGISIPPYTAKLTTQEAADFVGMSRPTFVKIPESGATELAELAKDSIEHHGTLPKAVPSLKRLPEAEA